MTIRRDLDGLRLQTPGDAAIYMIDQGRRRHISDPNTYNSLYRDWVTRVIDIDVNEIDGGEEIASGTNLIQGYGNAAVYLLDGGRKRWIENSATMDRYDFDWRKIIHVPMSVIDALQNGPGIVWPE
jgi:hypothetical protein